MSERTRLAGFETRVRQGMHDGAQRLVYLRGDVQLAHPAAFNVVTGVRP